MTTRLNAKTMLIWGLIAAVLAIVLVANIVLAIRSARESAKRAYCAGHLMLIGFALQCYHQDHGSFPPAYITDKAGKPMHSWRILLLPYIGAKELYSRYKFDEPWNSTSNSRLARLMPEVYRCPSDPDAGDAITNYVAVVGPHAAWRGAKGLSLSDFKDHFCCTISVVEVADSGIHWMEPRDLTFSQAAAGVNRRGALGISSHHNMAGANCCYADASCHVLHDGTSLDLLKELLAVDGDKKETMLDP